MLSKANQKNTKLLKRFLNLSKRSLIYNWMFVQTKKIINAISILQRENGLEQDWKGVCFMNPPYGNKISKWVKKAFEESQKGVIVVCLLPARTDTRWWWDYCMQGEIRFIKGRLKFKGRNTKGELVNYPATFPSAIVVFKQLNSEVSIPPNPKGIGYP